MNHKVLAFSIYTDKMILTSCDAHTELVVGADDNDLVNEVRIIESNAIFILRIGRSGQLTINARGDRLAYCLDSGVVGVIDLSNNKVVRMKKCHDSVSHTTNPSPLLAAIRLTCAQVCGSVKFIPDRPSELVSGGYDSAVLHFDFLQASLLSRDDLGM